MVQALLLGNGGGALLDNGGGADPNILRSGPGDSPVYAASYYGHAEVVAALLNSGADPNKGSRKDGFTPLLAASERGKSTWRGVPSSFTQISLDFA